MRNISVLPTLGYILLLFIISTKNFAIAKNEPKDIIEASQASFELKNGDRVVFLGNSLIEDDQQYGYIEFALASRWPDRDVTFRNLGWSGDTVFGDARSYFTSPPSAYELLIEQLTKAQPTVVFVAYGANEAFEGEAGLPRFKQGLNQLLDEIDSLGAKTVLLSPVPQMSAGHLEKLATRNKNLELYASAIARTASERDKQFVDLFNPLQEISRNVKLSDNGVHLNEAGYYYLASVMESGLGLSPRKWSVKVDLPKRHVEATGPATVFDSDIGNETLKFTIEDAFLPLPLPHHEPATADNMHVLSIKGLDKGYYTLTVDGSHVVAASAKEWSKGVAIRQGALFSQASRLRDWIVKKNELFFRQYRPLNRTYLTGFRSYEQGRHVEGLEQLDLLIGWLEEQIAGTRTSKSNVYQLTSIK